MADGSHGDGATAGKVVSIQGSALGPDWSAGLFVRGGGSLEVRGVGGHAQCKQVCRDPGMFMWSISVRWSGY